ncbi:uncharacterized protein JCM10292_003969 [Rhodotorula paludigena]|uniref:uncharacterized protein n=1 Tax=Rhodotorula paludigena TaxID=86838 RepID=UPI00317415EC
MAARESPLRLDQQPEPVLDRILALAAALDPAQFPTWLVSARSRALHRSARRVLCSDVRLEDDDSRLVDADADSDDAQTPSSLVRQVVRDDEWAGAVSALSVVRPVVPLEEQQPQQYPHFTPFALDEAPSDESSVPVPPLDPAALFLVLARTANLTRFTWCSYRLPPDELCAALGAACKNLARFEFDVAPSPLAAPTAADAAHDASAAPGSPSLGSTSPLLAGSTGPATAAGTSLRWDAPHLSSLPLSLASLRLAHLSQAGTRALAAALPSFPALESLELEKTLFVDDALCAHVGAGARGLKRLVVREMGGTKLSEAGLKEVFEGCEGIEVLELDGVEGRFSRSCWQKLAPLPSSLHTLRLSYSEHAPHKSWVLDHLASLPSILGSFSSSLHTLSITRRPHPAALVPGSHHLARYPIEPVVEPRALPAAAIDAIAEHGEGERAWRVLELDLFALDAAGLKKVLEGAPALQRLKVLFDDSFRNVLALGPSFAACPLLRSFLVSIPPQHTPELAPITPAEYLTAVPSASFAAAASASPPGSPPSPSHTRASPGATNGTSSSTATKEDKHHPLRALDALLPPTRDWRRFLKKAHSLERIVWTGRGGLGTWTFSGGGGRGLTKIEFEPTRPAIVGSEDEGSASPLLGGAGGRRRPSLSSPSLSPSSGVRRPRRASSVSLAGSCFSGLSLATGGGNGCGDSAPTSPLTSFTTPGSNTQSLSAAGGGGRSGSPTQARKDLATLPSPGGSSSHHHRRRTSTSSSSGGSHYSNAAISPSSAFPPLHFPTSALGLSLAPVPDDSPSPSPAPASPSMHASAGWAAPVPVVEGAAGKPSFAAALSRSSSAAPARGASTIPPVSGSGQSGWAELPPKPVQVGPNGASAGRQREKSGNAQQQQKGGGGGARSAGSPTQGRRRAGGGSGGGGRRREQTK